MAVEEPWASRVTTQGDRLLDLGEVIVPRLWVSSTPTSTPSRRTHLTQERIISRSKWMAAVRSPLRLAILRMKREVVVAAAERIRWRQAVCRYCIKIWRRGADREVRLAQILWRGSCATSRHLVGAQPIKAIRVSYQISMAMASTRRHRRLRIRKKQIWIQMEHVFLQVFSSRPVPTKLLPLRQHHSHRSTTLWAFSWSPCRFKLRNSRTSSSKMRRTRRPIPRTGSQPIQKISS